MELTLLKSKLHKARVTHAEVDYDGSCAIDAALLDAAEMLEYERIDVYNLSNGERLTTYAIAAERGSGVVSMNGAAAHKARPGDRLIVCCYCTLPEEEARRHRPRLVYLDDSNRIVRTADSIPVQAA